MIKLLIVDDEPNILSALTRVLHKRPWQITTCERPEKALELMTQQAFDLVLSDYRMPNIDGITLLQFVRQRQPEAMRLLLTGHGDREALIKAINQAEIFRFLSKPWDDYELLTALDTALELLTLRREQKRMVEQLQLQHDLLLRQRQAQEQLREQHPALFEVMRNEDGAIVLDEWETIDHHGFT
ncbi:response regulator [Atopomonas sediminilitoris]|uniref:response regulator n=1 Tax=Atopomonas sediminilitoris TaxID=2919919 RepID=UPI001F4ECD2B|nr:response regulator [Atopomonas sediminilitoris]MCJ8168668.1 response regulator [Atopomonas sediminilitoris]